MARDYLLPFRILKRKANLLYNFFYDYRRMVLYSSAVNKIDNKEKLKSLIVMSYHGIEKALSLPHPRKGFGTQKVHDLLEMLELYIEKYNHDFITVSTVAALSEYQIFSRDEITEPLDRQINKLKSSVSDSGIKYDIKAGVKEVTKADLIKNSNIDFAAFCSSRFSVRQFSKDPVDIDKVYDAISISQKTPSVCNRQSSRVWIVKDSYLKNKALEIGQGASGFSDGIGLLLVVTSDLACFKSSGERYQCWIDGGLFSMSLVYALHSKGLVTCFMNWSKEHFDDIAMKKNLSIPNSESIITLVAVGNPLDEFVVAESARMPLSNVVREI